MTLQDDIEKALFEDMPIRGIDQSARAEAIATEIERDYYIVKLADLPEVKADGDGVLRPAVGYAGGVGRVDYHEWSAKLEIARVLHLQSRESEAAEQSRRREELAQQYGYDTSYEHLSTMTQDLIKRLLHSEDEIARLKATS